MSVDLWKSIFDWATVALIALTVVSGAGALITGDIINKRQQARVRQFDSDLEKQKGETAKAQAQVLRLQQQRLPRTLKFDSNESLQALVESLKHKPFTAEILYKKGDGEASWFAEQIRGLLLSAGWTVPHPTPIPEDMSASAVERLKAQPDGVTLITKTSSDKDKPEDPETILTALLSKSLGSVARSPDAALPDKFVRIIILQKP
jgi:hypothetical protein